MKRPVARVPRFEEPSVAGTRRVSARRHHVEGRGGNSRPQESTEFRPALCIATIMPSRKSGPGGADGRLTGPLKE